MYESIQDYLLARWGEPTRRAEFEVQGLSVEIWKWAAEVTGEGVDIYVTLGAKTGHSGGASKAGHRTEFLLGLLPGQDAVASPFAALGLYGQRNGVAVMSGDTVPSAGPLWPGTEMMAFLILDQEEIIPKVQLSDGTHVHFLQAIPMHESELAFRRSRGVDALMGWWENNQVPFWESVRGPSVP
ncbi:suppressor of fused domain protein [Paenarthrobacter aurescens]|uniref:suppressor of fused domain protein n=1 Tax=Paenarthrobacter aurescens TaxID=43663 RepID=UPI0021C011FD|nr:suppressor of fused domain protein [Paenarthrobacter aurescens]MCT9870840.1 suppressor of fused domain protein [Paenarthrobacter aurescens]